jgi:hypothetical protein
MTVNNHLFDANDPKSIATIQALLAKVLLPWAPDTSSPPAFLRVDGLGRTVATVTSWLGGYGDPHGATLWGYKVHFGVVGNPSASGIINNAAIPGYPGAVWSKKATKAFAMHTVDEFLSQHPLGFNLLESTALPVSVLNAKSHKIVANANSSCSGSTRMGTSFDDLVDAHPDVFCEVPRDAHKCYGTGNHRGFC